MLNCITSETAKERKTAYQKAWWAKNGHDYYIKNKDKIDIANKTWAAANPEKRAEMSKRWARANPEKRRAIKKAWTDANREKVRLSDRKRARTSVMSLRQHNYYEAHKEKILSAVRDWRKLNPDKKKSFESARRARKYCEGAEAFSINEIFERDGWRCQLCHRKVNNRLKWPNPLSPSLDHIVPLSKDGKHIKTNVHLTHLRCNFQVGVGGVKQLLLM